MSLNLALEKELNELDNDPVNDEQVQAIKSYLQEKISGEDIDLINGYLTKNHRAKITLDDLSCMLILHAHSVTTNDHGASPHKRFVRWSCSSRNHWGTKWDSLHVKVGLTAFSAAKITIKTGEPARKQAATYKVKKEVLSLLKMDSHT